MRRGIYQGWTGWRNLGDEALFASCRRALPRIAWSARPPFDAPAASNVERVREAWQRHVVRLLGPRPALLGGGTLINRTPAWLDAYRQLRRDARKPVPVFAPGVANPAYWADKRGWRDTRAEWREALADLPEVGVRGPLSKRLLDEAGFRNVTVAGDPALIFHRRRSNPPRARRSVGLNAGRAGGEMWGSEDRLVAALATCARRLAAQGFEVRVVPVWDRDEPVCREVAMAAGLGDAVDPLVLDAEAFVHGLERFDVVVTVKLHAAVLAAAAVVPFVAVEYRPKVRDFTESLGWTARTIRSCDVEGEALARAVLDLYDEAPVACAQLGARAEEMAQTFRAYTRRMEPLLLA
jgi:hypothetical protein